MIWVHQDAIDWAYLDTLGLVEMPDALGALGRIYDVDVVTLGNGLVRALRYAHVTVDTV
jgi:hypothetical protein